MERRALVGEVRGISEMTFYARYGDSFAWFVVTIAAAAALFAAFSGRVPSNRLPSPDNIALEEGHQESH
jgi:apolipoprotein N-acyltransferase